jgi:hypothetical protein
MRRLLPACLALAALVAGAAGCGAAGPVGAGNGPSVVVTTTILGDVTRRGLAVSYHAGTAGGATIAGLAVAEFFAVLAAQEAARAYRHTRRQAV